MSATSPRAEFQARLRRNREAIATSQDSIARCREKIGDTLRILRRWPYGIALPLGAPSANQQRADRSDQQADREQRDIDREVRRTVRAGF